ncbi:MAG: restriction endonuclease subunit S [Phycisphaeraceae bacterium]|nr:restriction endonuclease subunit S [Phycisphaeraceae bacterium]
MPLRPLGEVLTRSTDWITLDSTKVYTEVTVRLWGKGVIARGEKLGGEIGGNRRLRVHPREFILSRIDARNGAFGLVPAELDGAVVSNDFPCFRVDESALLPEYLGWLSWTRWFSEACKQVSEGTTNRVRLNEEKFLAIRIPLPPVDKQRRLVAKIDRLAAKIDEAHGLREAATRMASALPSRAAKVIDELDADTQPLGTLLREKSRNGLSARPSDQPIGHPILRISAGTSRSDGVVEESDHKYLDVTDHELQEYRLESGDLLACRFNGNLHYVGRFSLYAGTTGRTHLHPDKLIRFRVDISRVSPEYIRAVMNSPYGRERIESFCQTTAGNIGISAKNLNTIPVPVPTKQEQHRIVVYLDALQEKVKRLKILQQKTAAELDALLPSILDKAFKGEL